jgi:hypothetical protein
MVSQLGLKALVGGGVESVIRGGLEARIGENNRSLALLGMTVKRWRGRRPDPYAFAGPRVSRTARRIALRLKGLVRRRASAMELDSVAACSL